MSIRAHLFELNDDIENFGNDERLIAWCYCQYYGNDDELDSNCIVIDKEAMRGIIGILRQLKKDEGELWENAQSYFDYDIQDWGGEDEWRSHCEGLAYDIESTIRDSKAENFLIWYY